MDAPYNNFGELTVLQSKAPANSPIAGANRLGIKNMPDNNHLISIQYQASSIKHQVSSSQHYK